MLVSLGVYLFVTVHVITCSDSFVSSSSQLTVGGISNRTENVCATMDIRNQLTYIKRLGNCTVIEGYLRIILIENAEESQFKHLSFPNLREITGYLLLYRVYGLRSLSLLFPNLAVIRGQILFFNYALVIFEMPDLEEIGLHGLTRIVRGGVRMEKNPRLCYIDTIDWTKLTSIKMEDNFILQNKEVDECANVCPKDINVTTMTCPVIDVNVDVLNVGQKEKQPLCWNAKHCQKVCPAKCGSLACYSTKSTTGSSEVHCCHSQCIGGCTGPNDAECIACTSIFHNGRCLKKCPSGTYEYRQRRCLQEVECRAVGQSLQKNQSWKVVDGHCVEECPLGYTESKEDRHLCEKCQGHCPKVCGGLVIDNVAAAQRLKGCTIIDGILEIQIRGGSHVGAELEENLGMIEEVTQNLKIVRSYSLVSLRFLKNLRVIHGRRLHSDRYALFVLDNQNLQDLWDFDTHPNMTIKNGSLFFHFNRKLCMNKIEKLVEFVGKKDQIDQTDISPNSNGDQVACDIESLHLEIVNVNSGYAIIRWTNFNVSDPRELLSWVVNYRKATEENITIYSARDACGTDIWKAVDVKPDTDPKAPYIATILYSLEPFTKYAVYVQTYSIATAKRGAISKIIYLTTKPDMPSPVRDITVDAKYESELHVSWKEPSSPNGNVTHYYVYWQLQPLAADKFHQRNYCKDKLRLNPIKTSKETTIIANDKNVTNNGQCCTCPKTNAQITIEESERRYQIEFENFLHNALYVKNSLKHQMDSPFNFLRKKRSTSKKKRYVFNASTIEKFAKENPETYRGLLNVSSIEGNLSSTIESVHIETQEAAIVTGKTEIILTNLKHFQEYNIEVIACHEYAPDPEIEAKLCSNRAIISGRTLPNGSADTIDHRNITVTNGTSENSVQLSSTNIVFTWKEPMSPNGLIVLYEIELVRLDVPNYKPDILCIPHQKYTEGGSYVAKGIQPGYWAFRLRATSLAGSGQWTNYHNFTVAKTGAEAASLHDLSLMGIILGVSFCIFLGLGAVVVYVVRKKYNILNISRLDVVTSNPNYMMPENEYIPDEWEIPREKIEIGRAFGQGSFGMVHEGIARNLLENEQTARVAIKTLNENATIHDRYSFLIEASVMKAFNSYHIVKFLGVVSQSQPVLVVMELMLNGDLKNFLRIRRPDDEDNIGLDAPTLSAILQWSAEIADGMAYLASKKYVHRDLAARNCLVSAEYIVKIGDFGMTRDVYETDYYRKGSRGMLPVRWMAPESLKDGVFTCSSDVWSFGVVLWEMASLAAQPYQGLSNETVLGQVIEGYSMPRYPGCPDKLYYLMKNCWRKNPKERPTFYQILEDLSPDLSESFHKVSFYFGQLNKDDVKKIDNDNELMEENEDLEMIHSQTPLHPTKSSSASSADQNRPPKSSQTDVNVSENEKKMDMDLNSRGFPMPLRLQLSEQTAVSPLSYKKKLSSDFIPNNKTSVTELDLLENRLQGKRLSENKSRLLETTNDSLSSGETHVDLFLNRSSSSLYEEDVAKPDVIIASQESSKESNNSRHRNGMVNGVVTYCIPANSPKLC